MDSKTTTDDMSGDIKINQEHLLLEIIKELCSDNNLSSNVRGKVSRIITESDLIHDEGIATLLGFMHQTPTKLTYEEQVDFFDALIKKIQNKIPSLTKKLQSLKQTGIASQDSHKAQIKDLQESLNDKLNKLQEQENEKLELMMELLNHRLSEVNKFSDSSSELLTLKTKILEAKSKILHVKILTKIFSETNQSIEAYSEIYRDLKNSMKEIEEEIKHFKDIIENDNK